MSYAQNIKHSARRVVNRWFQAVDGDTAIVMVDFEIQVSEFICAFS